MTRFKVTVHKDQKIAVLRPADNRTDRSPFKGNMDTKIIQLVAA